MRNVLLKHPLHSVLGMLFILNLFAFYPSKAQIQVKLVEKGGQKTLEISGIPFGFADSLQSGSINPAHFLKVYTGKHTQIDDLQHLPPIGGKYQVIESDLLFEPYFGFKAGMYYTAFIGLEEKKPYHFQIESQAILAKPKLLAIYPEADSIPANVLKFYLFFSEAMQEGQAYDKVNLMTGSGDTLDHFFVPLEPELWNSDQSRISLWADPGKIKRGLLSSETKEEALQGGMNYHLLIQKNWKSLAGETLSNHVQKTFYTLPDDREKPNVKKWKILVPQKESSKPLEIFFGEALDHVLALQCIHLQNKEKTGIKGQVSLGSKDRIWIFSPEENWKSGKYTLHVQSKLEDLAGNNLNRLFDKDLSQDKSKTPDKEEYLIRFKIR